MATKQGNAILGIVTVPTECGNIDILDMIRRGDLCIEELSKSASASLQHLTVADFNRMVDMHVWVTNRFSVYTDDATELDLPHAHPNPIPLPDPPVVEEPANPDIAAMIRLYAVLRVTQAASASALAMAGYSSADEGRVQGVLNKIVVMLEAFEAKAGIDLPDTLNEAD